MNSLSQRSYFLLLNNPCPFGGQREPKWSDSVKKNKVLLSMLMIFFILGSGLYVLANTTPPESSISPSPPESFQGEPWRIAFVETDPFVNFAGTFQGLLVGLHERGWIDVPLDQIPFSDGQEDSLVMWQWLEEHNQAPYLTFVQDAHYSLVEEEITEDLLLRIEEVQDIDLFIATGTTPGRLLSQATHEIPTLIFSTSNAVQAGIIDSAYDSGQDHIWAHMDATRYQRQIGVFHDIFHFEKLGIVYEDSLEGRVYAALEDLEALQKDLGFQLVTRTVNEASGDEDRLRYHHQLLQAYQELATEVDAFYLTAGTRDNNQLSSLLRPFYDAGIPVFSQMGASEVRHGALLSLYRADFIGVGRFGADQIGRVLNGEQPRNLSQVYGDTPSIVLNMEAADRTGYNPPFEILLIADELYHHID